MDKDKLLSLIPQHMPFTHFLSQASGLCSAFWQPFNVSIFHIVIATFPWGTEGQVPRFLSKKNWEVNIIWPLHETQSCPHPSPGCPRNHIPLSPGWLASTFPEIFGVGRKGGKLSLHFSLLPPQPVQLLPSHAFTQVWHRHRHLEWSVTFTERNNLISLEGREHKVDFSNIKAAHQLNICLRVLSGFPCSKRFTIKLTPKLLNWEMYNYSLVGAIK